MAVKVAKFGGTSLADAAQFRRVRDIVLSDPERRYVVPSAPGKRMPSDIKVTDLLYTCYREVSQGHDPESTFAQIRERYLSIAEELRLSLDVSALLERTFDQIERSSNPDFVASRGEYLAGLLLADFMGWDFIDAAEVVFFDRQGTFNAEWTNQVMIERLARHEHAIIPGFYGSLPNGDIKTFSRGGSDISGAVVARAAQASVYENWTDVPGFLMADPRVVEKPRVISVLTYRELRELSYMGATVLHEDAVFPVRKAGIPTNIRNTNAPDQPGTLIDANGAPADGKYTITGIAGRKGFSILTIEKGMMNSELGFGRRVLQALEELGISFEHLPTGIDTMCLVLSDQELGKHGAEIIARIQESCKPDSIEIKDGLALIATVGRGMIRARGTAAKLFKALAEVDVNVRMIDQGSSELNIIVGVDENDFERAMRAIYARFVEA